MTTAIEITWAGGEHEFALPLGHLRALQTKCDAGPAWILNRLRTGAWRVDDVVETIRLGLEGGGMAKADARLLVSQHIDATPLLQSAFVAQLILGAALTGVADDPVGEIKGEAKIAPMTSPAANGDSVGSTASELQSDSPPTTSTN